MPPSAAGTPAGAGSQTNKRTRTMEKKKYIAPSTEEVFVKYESDMLAGSDPKPGVSTGDEVVEEYDEGDESYSKPVVTPDLWADGDTGNEW